MDIPEITLPQHEAASESRAMHLGDKIDKLKENKMGQPVNVFTPTADGASGAAMLPMAMMAGMGNHGAIGGGLGAGLGAGLVGGLLGGLLFGGRGFGTGLGGDGVGMGAVVASNQNNDSMAILNAIGSVKDMVNSNTMALTATVTNGDTMLTNTVTSGFAAQSTNTLQQTIMLLQQLHGQHLSTVQELCGINQNVSAQGCMTRETVATEATTTRALMVAQYEATLNRKLVEQANEITELRNEGARRHDHDELRLQITNTNTAVAAQAQGQQQQQQQQQFAAIQQLFPILQGILQVAHATNGNVIVGNAGATTTGAQTANPVNVVA